MRLWQSFRRATDNMLDRGTGTGTLACTERRNSDRARRDCGVRRRRCTATIGLARYFYRILRTGYVIQYLPEVRVLHAHRDTMPALTHQLQGYRRGETAFLLLVLARHGDLRALGQMFLWIPRWRTALFS